MKIGKISAVIFLICMLSISVTSPVQASGDRYDGGKSYYDGHHSDYDGHHSDYDDRNYDYNSGGDCNRAVGAPLDGGLLALLAGAGITYFAARRKRKNEG